MAEEDTVMLLKEISRKLDQLIILTKMGRQEEIRKIAANVRGDPILGEIRKLSDGTVLSSQIKSMVSKATSKSESLVEKKIYELVDDGVIVPIRKGREIYYIDSGLIG
jgi:hypothetical protein